MSRGYECDNCGEFQNHPHPPAVLRYVRRVDSVPQAEELADFCAACAPEIAAQWGLPRPVIVEGGDDDE